MHWKAPNLFWARCLLIKIFWQFYIYQIPYETRYKFLKREITLNMLSIYLCVECGYGCITIAFINLCENVLPIKFFGHIKLKLLSHYISNNLHKNMVHLILVWIGNNTYMCTSITFSHAFSPTSCIFLFVLDNLESLYNTVTIDATKTLLSATRAMLQHHWIKDIFLPKL